MLSIFADRLKLLRQALAASDSDALVETHGPNIFYLTGFSGDAGVLLVERSAITLFTDSRFTIQAKREAPGLRTRIHKGPLLTALGEGLLKKRRISVTVAPSRITLAGWTALKHAAGKGVRWSSSDGMVEQLRAVKDTEEIAQIKASAKVASEVMAEVILLVRPGVTELDLAAEIGYRMRLKGASGESFEAIVASGPRSALPHARPTARPIGKNELVVLDLGAILRRYCSDITRTVHVGRASASIRRWYQAVLEAQQAALDTLRAGATAGSIDAAARKILQRKQLGSYFIHSTGHGIGLEIHEGPRLARGGKTLLDVGNVVTLEPGVYMEGVGGIRIEDDAVVTSRGAELLTTVSRELLEL